MFAYVNACRMPLEIHFIYLGKKEMYCIFNTFGPRGVYILRGLSSHQSWGPLNFNIPRAGVF
jgi:hypothetical protein